MHYPRFLSPKLTLMTVPEIDELFAQALSGDYDDESSWEAILALRRIGTRDVFEKAARWCQSSNVLARARGADVLAQLGKTADHPSNSFPEDSYLIVSGLVQRETNALPLKAAIAALGHLENPRAVPLIANFAKHPDPGVRFDVAFALGSFPNDPESVAALLQLMHDADEDIRDWATFGLGVLGNADSAEIREALVRGLSDSSEDVREEAMLGLASRKDDRVLSALLSALQSTTISDKVIEAAYLMLGMEKEHEGWKHTDYAAALRERFSL
jgi:HEAT repeat protein